MNLPRLVIAVCGALLLAACTVGGIAPDATLPAPTVSNPTATTHVEQPMNPNIETGPIPSELDIRAQRRDMTPLPNEALLRFQQINRGKNPAYNYRWVLYEDGRWFLAANTGADIPWDTPFDAEVPTRPTGHLPAAVVTQIHDALIKADFADQPPYQLEQGVEDGSFAIVTARIDGRIHEVIYEAYEPPLVLLLRSIAFTYR